MAFLIAGGVCFVNPKETFAGLADILGFLFLMVGVWWMIRAFALREFDPTWWLGLTAGILMTIMAFYVSGQFFIHKAYTLLGSRQTKAAFDLRSEPEAVRDRYGTGITGMSMLLARRLAGSCRRASSLPSPSVQSC